MLFYARTMPPRLTTTRQSPKTSKAKNVKVGESESTPKVESMIKMSQKKPPAPPPLYRDTDMGTTSKVPFPTWTELYNKTYNDDFPEFTPHSDLEARVLDDRVFQNIKLLSLHMVASRTPIFRCVETLEWIINHTNAKKNLLNDVDGKRVGVFLPVDISKYYKLGEPEVYLNTDFVVKLYEHHNTSQLLSS